MAERVPRMRRATSDFVLSACALVVLVGALAAFDPRVKSEISLRMNGARASTELVAAGYKAQSLGALVVQAVKAQAEQNAPMMIFVVAATVLTIFMVRT